MARQRAAPSRSAPRPKPAPASAPPRPAAPAAAPYPQQHHSAPPPAPAAQHAPPPAMPQQSSGGGFLSGLMGSVAQGAALGTGSALAHRAVDSMMGLRGGGEAPAAAPAAAAPMEYAPAPAAQQQEGPCASQAKAFAECMSRNNGEMTACQFYFEAMQQCKAGMTFA